MDKLRKRQQLLDVVLGRPPKIHVLHGDVYASLKSLPNNSIDCIVTSPPYWDQRDYGFNDQIGLEPTLNAYLAKLVIIWRVLLTKLHPNGVIFLNIGDKYISKYGNTPLGMIPYRLVIALVQDGWRCDDILIWYKTNHQPSSVSDRFVNAYEPVFVLTRDATNYYTQVSEHPPVITTSLEASEYDHVAVYPTSLVKQLFTHVHLDSSSHICDIFGGSGTVGACVQAHNAQYHTQWRCTLIEAYTPYVHIIRHRCMMEPSQVRVIQPIPYPSIPDIPDTPFLPLLSTFTGSSFTHPIILNENADAHKYYTWLLSSKNYAQIPDDAVVFVVARDHSLSWFNMICHLSQWVLRNIIVVPTTTSWIPIFMLVKDIHHIPYRFNMDAIRITHKTEDDQFVSTQWIGIDVVQKDHATHGHGVVCGISGKKPNGIPQWILVQWDDASIDTYPIINEPSLTSVSLSCPSCHTVLPSDAFRHPCPTCQTVFWQNRDTLPIITCVTPPHPQINSQPISHFRTKTYTGKYATTSRKNQGQSPGARASTSPLIFNIQRRYNVDQWFVTQYLNTLRISKGLSKNDITRLYPSTYRHTVGHWLRSDMSGCIPKTSDLPPLIQVLDIPSTLVEYMTSTGAKLQAVIADAAGKAPSDFMALPLHDVLQTLRKL